tara:strand:+ start:394 stop:627 length:234 start_codon:yes stop_codon:yes gene_type:complete
LSEYLETIYAKSVAIGPFQNKIERKKSEVKKQDKPYVKLEELKETNIKNIEPKNITPLRSSSIVSGGNFVVSRLSLT